MAKHIVPRYKLIMFYDLADRHVEDYYQFVMNEMIPALNEMNLFIFRAFHTIEGEQGDHHPNRQVEYVAENLETVEAVLKSDEWRELEDKLCSYVTNYSKKLVQFRKGFQL